MVGDCDPRDQKKSIAAIRAAVGVPDDVVVVMVDDKVGAVVGAGARDALVAVRPFMGNDAELDATAERSLEREIAERAAPAHECKRKREVTAEKKKKNTVSGPPPCGRTKTLRLWDFET
jgi:hypothetical protein